MRFLNVWMFTLVGGLYFAGLMLYTTPEKLRMREVAQHGQLVPVRVTRLAQVHLGKTHSYYLHFYYQGRNRSILVGRSDVENNRVGQQIPLRHLERYPNLFLLPRETLRYEFIPQIFLFVFGIYAAVYSVKKLWEHE